MLSVFLLQAQAESAEPVTVQERSGSGGGGGGGSRGRRSDSSADRRAVARRNRQRGWCGAVRGPAGSGDALAAASQAESPAEPSSWPGADDRGTKSRSATQPKGTTAAAVAACARPRASPPRLSRLPGPEGDTPRPGQALQGGLGRLSNAASPTRQVPGCSALDSHAHAFPAMHHRDQPALAERWR